jgi:hypothetical protein
MSLNVPPEIAAKAQTGVVSVEEFINVIRESLPRGWKVIEGVVARLKSNDSEFESYGDGPMDDETRGEVLRMMAGTAMRTSLEKHFGVNLVFQNCHNIGAEKPTPKPKPQVKRFTSIEEQLRAQRPENQHC